MANRPDVRYGQTVQQLEVTGPFASAVEADAHTIGDLRIRAAALTGWSGDLRNAMQQRAETAASVCASTGDGQGATRAGKLADIWAGASRPTPSVANATLPFTNPFLQSRAKNPFGQLPQIDTRTRVPGSPTVRRSAAPTR